MYVHAAPSRRHGGPANRYRGMLYITFTTFTAGFLAVTAKGGRPDEPPTGNAIRRTGLDHPRIRHGFPPSLFIADNHAARHSRQRFRNVAAVEARHTSLTRPDQRRCDHRL